MYMALPVCVDITQFTKGLSRARECKKGTFTMSGQGLASLTSLLVLSLLDADWMFNVSSHALRPSNYTISFPRVPACRQ